jgi:molybdopterin molybdotransferase
MTELFTVWPPGAACAELLARTEVRARIEWSETAAALGRVAAAPIVAGESLPPFARSTMDGFAVRAADTFGASESAPAYLSLDGEVAMGSVARAALAPHGARRVHTGSMLPPGADAVAIVEDTSERGAEIELLRAAAPGDNTVAEGEDVRLGECVVAAGRALRPQDLGALHALGITRVAVSARPLVAILSTGDEVVAPERVPPPGSMRDVNAVTIAATVERAGGIARYFGIVNDDERALEARAREALERCDALVISAGSSVSARDFTARAIGRLGAPGVFVHGIALRPGKPTILATCGGKPVIGLPGNPVSALVVAWRLVRPLVLHLAGAAPAPDGLGDERSFEARLTETVPSRVGREDYVPARLHRDAGGLCAEPVFGKSSLIFTLVRSDGFIEIPLESSGLPGGATVRVIVP